MANAESLLRQLVDQIVNTYVDHSTSTGHQHSGGSDEDQGVLHQRLFLLSVRLLGGTQGGSSGDLGDEFSLVQALRRDVTARSGSVAGGEKAARLSELHQRLVNSGRPSPQTRWATLQMLRQVAKDRSKGGGRGGAVVGAGGGLAAFGHAQPGTLLPPQSMLQGGLSASSHRHPNTGGQPSGHSPSLDSSLNSNLGRYGNPYTGSFPASLDGGLTAESSRAAFGEGSNSRPSTTAGGFRGGPDSGLKGGGTGAVELTAREPTLVKDVLYSCQGINGKLVSFCQASVGTGHEASMASRFDHSDSDGRDGRGASENLRAMALAAVDAGYEGRGADQCEGYRVLGAADVSSEQRLLVTRLTELGWLFKQVSSLIISSRSSPSSVRQALAGALSAEMTDFYRLMAILEGQGQGPIPTPADALHPNAPCRGYLTLRRLTAWLAEPTRRMRLLAHLGDASRGLTGGALAGRVYGLGSHGDPWVASYIGKILHQVSIPLFDMIRRWVLEGELEDPQGEFFIARADLDAEGNPVGGGDPWWEGYRLLESRLPPFLSHALALQILRAGKGIHFLQGVCGDAAWVQQRASQVQSLAASSVSIGQVASLERFVNGATSAVDARVIEVMFTSHAFTTHCDAIRRFLMLGQGDFVQALMDLMCKELDKRAPDVSEVVLNHLLRQAVASSSAKYESEEVVERLRARKDRGAGVMEIHARGAPCHHSSMLLLSHAQAPVSGAGLARAFCELGWDVFSLQYQVRGPLATVFTPKAMSAYLRVFHLLWSLKRAEAALAGCWTSLQCEVGRPLHKLGAGGRHAQGVVRRCLRLRNEMSHFVTNLQYYLMFEVMEGAWREFEKAASAAPNLDALLQSHSEYLTTLLRKSLLDERCEGLRVVLTGLVGNAIALRGLVGRFADQVQKAQTEHAAQSRRGAAAAGRGGARGGWGTTMDATGGSTGSTQRAGVSSSGGGGGGGLLSEAGLAECHSLLEDLEARQQQGVSDFTEGLPAQALEEVRFLLYRLDFSDFHKRTTNTGSQPQSPATHA
ncbi:MAG: hypothetical protein WDW38_010111 [Sanguina aurantia]